MMKVVDATLEQAVNALPALKAMLVGWADVVRFLSDHMIAVCVFAICFTTLLWALDRFVTVKIGGE